MSLRRCHRFDNRISLNHRGSDADRKTEVRMCDTSVDVLTLERRAHRRAAFLLFWLSTFEGPVIGRRAKRLSD